MGIHHMDIMGDWSNKKLGIKPYGIAIYIYMHIYIYTTYVYIYIGQRLGVPRKAIEVHCVPV